MLINHKEEIQRLVRSTAALTGLEIAVFDENSDIISATEAYIEKKGNSVHKPSLMEVISSGNILVNKPGRMPSCVGCRFQENCPSTIEILNTIYSSGRPVGVISFTSFTEEGHNRLTESLNTYIDLVSDLSHVISLFTHESREITEVNPLYVETLKHMKETLFLANEIGSILFASEGAKTLLPSCTLNTMNLFSLFPELASSRTVKRTPQIIHLDIGSTSFSGELIPIHHGGEHRGYLLKLSSEGKSLRKKTTVPEKAFQIDRYLLGKSTEMAHTRDRIQRISASDSTVIIHGETGTGKELAARSIHNLSRRSRHPFVSINCASIPETLFESELFGYEEGAFTGAKRGGKPGKFELAQMGTLFLDEIGELPLYMQAKLLRVLQDHSVERVGGTRGIPVDVRIIAATNRNLEVMIREETFRSDLYFRLNVIPLEMPPLRDRIGDALFLASHFLEKHSLKENRSFHGFTKEAAQLLASYDWPGNVRELENAVEYGMHMEDTPFISPESLPPYVRMKSHRLQSEKEKIRGLIDRYGDDLAGKEKAAAEMGISLRTLYRKLKA